MHTWRIMIENRTRDRGVALFPGWTMESDVLSGIIERVAHTLMKGLHLWIRATERERTCVFSRVFQRCSHPSLGYTRIHPLPPLNKHRLRFFSRSLSLFRIVYLCTCDDRSGTKKRNWKITRPLIRMENYRRMYIYIYIYFVIFDSPFPFRSPRLPVLLFNGIFLVNEFSMVSSIREIGNFTCHKLIIPFATSCYITRVLITCITHSVSRLYCIVVPAKIVVT